MHCLIDVGKLRFHELPLKCRRKRLGVDGFLSFRTLWNSCKDIRRTRSNLNQNMQMIGRNHTREQGLQVCRRNFLKKTFGNTSKRSLKLSG